MTFRTTKLSICSCSLNNKTSTRNASRYLLRVSLLCVIHKSAMLHPCKGLLALEKPLDRLRICRSEVRPLSGSPRLESVLFKLFIQCVAGHPKDSNLSICKYTKQKESLQESQFAALSLSYGIKL